MAKNLWKSYSFVIPVGAAGTTTADMLSYDGQLSRVRVDVASLLAARNANGGFEVDTAGWTVNGGTLVRSTAQHHTGAASGLLTPTGTDSIARAFAPASPVEASMSYSWSVWVYSAAGYSQVTADVDWYDASGTFLSTTIGATTAIPAATWTKLATVATTPAGAASAAGKVSVRGTPPASAALYVDDAALGRSWPAGSTWTVQRSTDAVRWATIRGGTAIPVDPGATPVDDYEFAPSVNNQYRVQVYSGAALVVTFTDSITPLIGDAVWLKHVAYPFLNRTIDIADAGDMGRRARGGVFDIVAASLPIAVTDVRGGRAYELTVATATAQEADDLDVMLGTGDVLYLQSPPQHPVPSGYYQVGDTTRSWRGANPAELALRWFTLPLTECAAPPPTVVGATTTWAAVVNRYAKWGDLVAAASTWNAVTEAIAGTGDVITG